MSELDFINDLQLRWRAGYGAVVIAAQAQQAAYELVRRAVHTIPLVKSEAVPPTLERWSCASGSLVLVDHETLAVGAEITDFLDYLKYLYDHFSGKSEPRRAFILADIPDLDDSVIARHMLEAVFWARTNGHLFVLVQHTTELPPTLKPEIAVLEYPLPSREELTAIFNRHSSNPTEIHIDNLTGLTSVAAENAVVLTSLKAKDAGQTELDAATLRVLKEKEISKRQYLQVITPKITLDSLLGHEVLKEWGLKRRRIFTEAARLAGLPSPKGMALVGPPGTGKTRMAEAFAGTWGMSLVLLDMGAVKSSYVGESEANMADALKTAEACSPCILLIDEVERSISTGDRDGGVAEALLGKLLTWTSTKTKPVFLMFTSNYPQRLPPALIRKGRLDQIFCLDLPTREERVQIWEYYLMLAGLADVSGWSYNLSDFSDGWSGAEIEACVNECRVRAFNEGISIVEPMIRSEMADIQPLSKTMSTEVEEMRAWGRQFATPTTRTKDLKASNNSPAVNVSTARKVTA